MNLDTFSSQISAANKVLPNNKTMSLYLETCVGKIFITVFTIKLYY